MQKNATSLFSKSDLLTLAFISFSAVILGILVSFNFKVLILLLLVLFFLILFRYTGVAGILYLYALIWWLPIGTGGTLSFTSGYFVNLAMLEVLAYGGALLMMASQLSKYRKSYSLRFHPDVIWLFLILLLAGGLIASPGINTLAGFVTLRRSTVFFLAMVFLCKSALTDQKIIIRILYLSLIGGCLFLGFILFAGMSPGVLFKIAPSYLNTSRLGGIYVIPLFGEFFYGPNNIGLITGMQAILAFVLMFLETRIFRQWFLGVAFASNMGVLILTGSRGGLISLGLVLMPLSLYILWLQKKLNLTFFLVVIGIGMAIVLPTILTPEITGRLQSMLSWSILHYDSSVQIRLNIFRLVFDYFIHEPFGIGYAVFVTRMDNFILWEQNLLLNTAMGGGFLGLIGLSGFFALLFGRGSSKVLACLNTWKKLVILAALSPSFVFFLNALASDPNSENSVYLSWLMLGIAYASISLRNISRLKS